MKHFLVILVGLLLTIASWAQQLQPAQLTITPTTLPEVLQVLDNTGAWATIGNVDPTTHTFMLPIAQGGNGTSTPSLTAGTSISITGSWPNQTITNTSPFATLSDPLPIAHGGTGVTNANLTAGPGITVTGSWPNQTIGRTSGVANNIVVTKFTSIAQVIAPPVTLACQTQGCTPTGTGYGASATGTLTLTSNGGKFVCSTYPQINVTTNAGGNITVVNSLVNNGQCTTMGGTYDEVWSVSGGLSAGSNAMFVLPWSAIAQTWNAANPATLKLVTVWALGAGAQGGGGAITNSGTAGTGGSGGGAGGWARCDILGSQAGASQTVTIGLGGRGGGLPGTTASSAGTSGIRGLITTFGSLCAGNYGGGSIGGNPSATGTGGGGGAGYGFGGNGSGPTGGAVGIAGGASGGSASIGGVANGYGGGGGGGGSLAGGTASNGGGGWQGGGGSGGGVTTGLAAQIGGVGGQSVASGQFLNGGTAGAVNGVGGAGNIQAGGLNLDSCSGGGGGGGGLTNTIAGNGGSSCFGGGGGGGGSVVAGASSGAGFGGIGGDGEIYVIEYY